MKNLDQAAYWNDRAGQSWVARGRDLDAQLEPFGLAVADRLALVPGDRVLDVGCGAGATSLMLARRVRPGEVLGVDISAPLLARARERGAADDNLRFELVDAQSCAFGDAPYDAVFSRFGVMFFADPVEAFHNLLSATRTGGKLGFACWRAMRENPAFVLPLDAALPFLPSAPRPAEPGAPGPFAFEDGDRVREILLRAGYEDVTVAAHDAELVFAGRSDLEGAVDLALEVGPLGRALPEVDPAARERVREAVRGAFARYHGPSGVTLPSATWLVTARRPAT